MANWLFYFVLLTACVQIGMWEERRWPKHRTVRTYTVLHWVSATALGTSTPWIAGEPESNFEATHHRVDRHGTLTLYRYHEVVAVFPIGKNGGWMAFTVEAPVPVATP